MDGWMIGGAYTVLGLLVFAAAFFCVLTRGALVARGRSALRAGNDAHVYPIYSNMRLIKLIDHQPIISTILLFQYHRLVSEITSRLAQLNLHNKKVLITSCAFGNVIAEVVSAARGAGAEQVVVTDLIQNELVHARAKLGDHARRVQFSTQDATCMTQADATVAANVLFFLLHELPDELKMRALSEAGRVLEPGGQLYLAEFHRPHFWPLRVLSWIYFKVFEPFGLALWNTHDPQRILRQSGDWNCERTTCLFGNFQVIVATKRSRSGTDSKRGIRDSGQSPISVQ